MMRQEDTMRVTVYYRKSLRDSYDLQPNAIDGKDYDAVCLVPDAAHLEDVFRRMNVVTGNPDLEIPIRLKVRSMSVGDLAYIEGDGLYLCASMGFQQVPFNVTSEFRLFFARRDPMAPLDAASA